MALGNAEPSPDPPIEHVEFLDRVAARLSSDGFSVQRKLQFGSYSLDIFATRPLEGTVYVDIKVPWFDIVAVASMPMPSPGAVQDYLSYVSKYIVKNRHSFNLRINGLNIVTAIVSSTLGEATKWWVSGTSPPYSEFWARLGFPVLVDLAEQQIFYYRKPRNRQESLCRRARALCDSWFSFQLALDSTSRRLQG